MSEKRSISIRKVIQTLITIIVVAGCTIAMLSADRLQRNKKVRSVSVHIRNGNKVHFLDEAEVMNLLFNDRHIDPQNTILAELDVHKMEDIVRTNPWVSDAQVYVDNERNINVFVTQRVPVARLFEENGNSYYLDTALNAMPLSAGYTHYTPVVTGVPALRDDSISKAQKGKILSLVDYVSNHSFWNAQIAQIVVTDDENFELIPILGKQRILLGDTARLEKKLGNLFAFYQQVCNKVGWDKYETIDLRYEGQVVASPAIAWKIPVDRALSNMNWVKAVLEAGDKNEIVSSDSTRPASSITPAPAAATVAPAIKLRPVTPSSTASAGIKPKPSAFAGAQKPKTETPAKSKPKQTAAANTVKTIPQNKPKAVLLSKPAPVVKKDPKPVKKTDKTPAAPVKKKDEKKKEKDKKKTTSDPKKQTTNH